MFDESPLPDWVFPPPGGYTVDQFVALPDLPKRTELIDGGLVFTGPQTAWHSHVVGLLSYQLDRQAPEHLRAAREIVVRLGLRQGPVPNVIVVTAESFDRDLDSMFFEVDEVTLAVEVVSPDTEERDRGTKPRLYSAAGIRHFWRVENDNGKAVVYVYHLDPAGGTYVITGIHRDRLRLTVPYDIDIDLNAVGARIK